MKIRDAKKLIDPFYPFSPPFLLDVRIAPFLTTKYIVRQELIQSYSLQLYAKAINYQPYHTKMVTVG